MLDCLNSALHVTAFSIRVYVTALLEYIRVSYQSNSINSPAVKKKACRPHCEKRWEIQGCGQEWL